ncbi:MAG: 2-amino-4-hydroxy-6-hydroxymethyldihydropteridine diphosphokinase [Anaerolineae bacterium]|jgi:2-amino-4-hydroxy-6-hydroxymethyldihydropteridine diphosphokinase|nr:2-amino-4-hydroxy-6-hydroxymethyldihydropteridine diphosphokinase [Anaerolineae bacterium]MBT7074612.1 2-amino-4-hydroxy-6-hydroxymethyldihydropteridine diphosphokinase [Anaerolineae bacterium]MBT7782717.1 2-amino-4-hydroxy-6-hydroxymethyldihydropteridine diphosphokinase [Anaerolineae bacterium]
MKRVFIALGTNLGDRLDNLRKAIASFSPELQIIRESAIYETPPWGYEDQPAFLNMVIEAKTRLEPDSLLSYLQEKEKSLGRVKNFRNGPRQIDLDILFYDNLILNEEKLTIPHPQLHKRAFVLVPLAEIAPAFKHPLLGKKIKTFLHDVDISEITPFSV